MNDLGLVAGLAARGFDPASDLVLGAMTGGTDRGFGGAPAGSFLGGSASVAAGSAALGALGSIVGMLA